MANDLEILIRAKNLTDEAFNDLKKQVEALGGSLEKTGGGFSDSAKGGLAFGAAAGVAGIAVEKLAEQAAAAYTAVLDLVRGFISAGSAIDDMRLKTGLAAQEIQLLAYQGSLVGVSVDTIGTAVVRMSKSIEEGTTKTRNAIRDLNLNIASLQAMSPADQFNAIATAIRGLATPGQQAAAAFAIFGRNAEILKVVRSNTESARQEFERLGFAMSDDSVAAADKLGDSLTTLSASWEGLKNRLGGFLVENLKVNDAVDGLTNILADMTKASEGAATGIGGLAAAFLLAAVKALPLVQAVEFLSKTLGLFANYIPPVKQGLKDLGVAMIDFQAIENAGIAQSVVDVKAGEKAKRDAARETLAERKRLAAEEKKDLADLMAYWTAMDKSMVALDKEAAAAYDQRNKENLQSLKELADARKKAADDYDDQNERNLRSSELVTAAKKKALEDELRMYALLANALNDISQLYVQMGASATDAMSSVLMLGQAALSVFAQLASGNVLGAISTGISAVVGLIGNIFSSGKKEAEAAARALAEVNREIDQLYDNLLQSAGGLEGLRAKANLAGVSLDRLFDKQKPEQYAAAIRAVQRQLDLWEEATNKTNEAMERYGITIDQMGEKFAQQELDKQAMQLYEDYTLLTTAGADVALVNEKMAAAINEYVQTSIKAGTVVPENMRPILQALVDQGLLTDEAGNKLENLDGIEFGAATTAMEDLVAAVQALVDALRQAFQLSGNLNSSIGNTPKPGNWGPDTDYDPNQGYAEGGFFNYRPGGYRVTLGERGDEAILNVPQMQAMMRQAIAGAAAEMGGSFQGGSQTTVINTHLNSRLIAREVVTNGTRRRQGRVGSGGVRGRA